MSKAAQSQAAAVSALIRRETKIIPRPSGASNRIEFGVIVRRGVSVAAGASITVGHSEWTATELDEVADRIAHALTGAGYYYHRSGSRLPEDGIVHFNTVYRPTHKHTEKMRYLIFEVREFAEANYERDGWDEVVEAWDDDEIAHEIGKARTIAGAVARVGAVVSLRHEHAEEIRATAF
jgi:hypothetical protein